jgi:GNAT superfamily N-acetyltransferase
VTVHGAISAPVPLDAEAHDLTQFSCGKLALDEWLHSRAARSEGKSARTYVACAANRVVGYYCFAAGSLRIDEIPKKLQRNMPAMVPVILIGRLAVDSEYQGKGIGKGLLKDAFLRGLQASQAIGARALLVHAIDAEAAAFYAGFGFIQFPVGSLTFFLPFETIRAALVG